MFVITALCASLVLLGRVQGQCDIANDCYDCNNSDYGISISWVCDLEDDCPEGDDETDCNLDFECASGTTVYDRWECDGFIDCATGGDDEMNCDHCSDTDTFYECPTSKLCLRISETVCDGYAHCEDGSDEANCECDENHHFECSDGDCILDDLVCDGEEDCEDGSDEEDCGQTCTVDEFRCLDHGSCVDMSVRCDGNEDCGDGSDEWYCVSLDPMTSAILVLHQGENSPVCTSHWDEDWNDMTCKEMGLGTSVSNGSTTLSSVSSYTANGFYLPEATDNPQTLLDLFGHGTECAEEAVTLTCNDDACGSRSQAVLNPERRKLLQGDDALEGHWPWQINLLYNGQFSCGGSLISSQWVLTAAHCIEDSQASEFSVRLGSTLSDGGSSHLQTIAVEEIHLHEDYNGDTLVNDIGLVKLAEVVDINDYVRPICLPTQWETFPSEEYVECYTTGWGGINAQAYLYPKRLQQLKMDLVSDETCSSDPEITNLDKPTMICAGYTDDFATVCNGDSGGPLVCRSRSTNTWTQAGVVSWGPVTHNISCKGYSVYAETGRYQTWMDDFNTGMSVTSLSEESITTLTPTTTESSVGGLCDLISSLVLISGLLTYHYLY